MAVDITLCDQDCTPFALERDEQIASYTDEELADAIATGTVTAEQAAYMHRMGVSWEVEVV
jgi:hypothetical protein